MENQKEELAKEIRQKSEELRLIVEKCIEHNISVRVTIETRYGALDTYSGFTEAHSIANGANANVIITQKL